MALTTTKPASTIENGSPPSAQDGAEWTTLFAGRLLLRQPTQGYRVNIDTVLLASFAATARSRDITRVADLGAGVGALGLCLAHLAVVGHLDLVESNETLATLALENLGASGRVGTVHRIRLEEGRGLSSEVHGTCDAVVCNPPFFPEGAARVARDPIAHVSRVGDLDPFLCEAGRCLQKRGSAFFVYPAMALAELFAASSRAQLVPKRMRLVHAFSDAAARIALVELKRARPGGLVIDPPLVEWSRPGERSPEVQALIEAEAIDRK